MRRNFFPASEESAGCPAQRLISFSQRSMFRAARGTPTDTVRSGWCGLFPPQHRSHVQAMDRQRFFQPFTQALCFAVASTMAQTGTIISISSSPVSSGKCPATWVIEFSRTLDAGGTQIGTVQVALTLEDVPRPNFGPMESMTFVSCATASRLD